MSFDIRKNYKGDPGRFLKTLSGLYGAPPGGIAPAAGAFANLIFSFRRGAKEYVLRLTPELHRMTAHIEGELDWLGYLAERDVPVVRTVKSEKGRLLEKIPVDGSYLSAVCFEKAEGTIAAELDNFRDAGLVREWGRVMGRMHALAKTYVPASENIRRYDWHDDLYLKTEKYVPENQPLVLDKFRELKKQLASLGRDRDSYALIHADFHMRNFFVDDGRITLFDFDDCQYCWLAADIAVSLFSTIIRPHPDKKRAGAAAEFLGPFLEGYAGENKLDREQLKHLPLFLKLREIINYIDGYNHWDFNNLTKKQNEIIERYRFNIEHDIPVVDMDFTKL